MIEGIDYYYYNIIPPVISQTTKQRCLKLNKTVVVKYNYSKRRPRKYMEDSELMEALNDYGDLGYADLPAWLKSELTARNLSFEPRQPASYEIEVTKHDLQEHQIFNNDLDISGWNKLLKEGMKYNG